MKYFPLSLIKYAAGKGIPIGLNDYMKIEHPSAPFTAQGNISIEKLDCQKLVDYPRMDSWELGVVIRHPVFDPSDFTKGIPIIVDAFIDMIDQSAGQVTDDNLFQIEDTEVLLEDAIFGYTENHYTMLLKIKMTVITK